MRNRSIRIYFRDNLHGESYLSFESEAEAIECAKRVRGRLRRITVHDGIESVDADLENRIRIAMGNLTRERFTSGKSA